MRRCCCSCVGFSRLASFADLVFVFVVVCVMCLLMCIVVFVFVVGCVCVVLLCVRS